MIIVFIVIIVFAESNQQQRSGSLPLMADVGCDGVISDKWQDLAVSWKQRECAAVWQYRWTEGSRRKVFGVTMTTGKKDK